MTILSRNQSQTPHMEESADFLDRIAAAAGIATAAHG